MNSDETKVRAVIIFDIIGRPPEHLVESLEKIIREVDEEKGVTVKSKNIKEPVLIKDQKDFYTAFAEIEVELDEVFSLAVLLFKYMPAHIEIISPEIIALTNSGWNDILNELASRLHAYDEIARVIQIEKNMLLKRIQELGGLPKPQNQETEKTKSKEKQKKKI